MSGDKCRRCWRKDGTRLMWSPASPCKCWKDDHDHPVGEHDAAAPLLFPVGAGRYVAVCASCDPLLCAEFHRAEGAAA